MEIGKNKLLLKRLHKLQLQSKFLTCLEGWYPGEILTKGKIYKELYRKNYIGSNSIGYILIDDSNKKNFVNRCFFIPSAIM